MQERTNHFNIIGNRANFNFKMMNQIRSKKSLNQKSKEPIRSQLKTLKRLDDNIEEPQFQQRALTTNKKLIPIVFDEIDSVQRLKNNNYDDSNPFRYNLMQLMVLIGKKEYYLDKITKDELRINRGGNQLGKESIEDVMGKIKKFLGNRVRYKYRSTFKMQYQIQLELVKYNLKKKMMSKSVKDIKEQWDSEEEDETPKKKKQQLSTKNYPDYQTWKKKNEVKQNQKVFILTSGYHALRDALIEKNWVENEDITSPFFDLKWTCRLNSDDYIGLADFQMINHFDCNQCLTSKYGIARNIRCIQGWESFFPRCYDLGDLVDFSDFIEDFKISKIHSILIEFNENPLKEMTERQRFKIRVAYFIMQRINKNLNQMVKQIFKDEFPFVHPGEWLCLFRDEQKAKDQQVQEILEGILKQNNLEDLENEQFLAKYLPLIQGILKQQLKNYPQSTMQGNRNIWIIKPDCIILYYIILDSSRGRGIRCFDDLYQIFDHIIGKENGYVAQKYIENPLIIKNRKFDIRQWVVVTELVPLKIYFYNECYIRFSAEEFDINKFQNRFSHLTNNAIAKFSSQFHHSEIKGNMWTTEDFSQYLQNEYGSDIFYDKIQPRFKEIVISSLRCCSDQMKNRKRSFEVYGYDFMIDEQFNAWLIEVNMSPSSDTSTQVTNYIVPKMLEDIAKIVVDGMNKSKKKIGGFQLIYNSDNKYQL